MQWLEVAVNTPKEEIDERCEKLAAVGCDGFIIESEEDFNSFIQDNRQFWGVVDEKLQQQYTGVSRIKFYLSDDEAGLEILENVRKITGEEPEINHVQDSDWENNWREFYKPIEIGEKLLVIPEWENPELNGRIPLILEPGLTFGTGDHPTTKLALINLEKSIRPDDIVLDLGCGSGILSIGAVRLGAKHAIGCDIDPKCSDIAEHNAELNNIGKDKFTVYIGDVLSDEGMRKSLGSGYNIVLANIVADVIIPMSEFVERFIDPNGVLIVSGIIDDRVGDVTEALNKNGFEVVEHISEEEWNSFICKLK